MKLFNKRTQILMIVAMGIILLLSTITVSLAWYTSNSTVRSENTTITSQEVNKLDVVIPEMSGEYNKYMGQTGLEPMENGNNDQPYKLEYTPVKITSNVVDSNGGGTFLKCMFTDSTYIDFIMPSEPDKKLTQKEINENFTIRLELLSINGEAPSTPTVYQFENGYFREQTNKKLLQLDDNTEYQFTMAIYFIREEGLRLLEQENATKLHEKYTFAFSDEKYMFSTFNLYATFEMAKQRELMFGEIGYEPNEESGDYETINGNKVGTMNNGTYVELGHISYTGASLLDANGNETHFPTPEIFTLNDNIDYSYYFEDWYYIYVDPDTSATANHIYRETNEENLENIHTLGFNNIAENTATFNSIWKSSKQVTIDYLDGVTEEGVTYIRPKGNHYSVGGYMQYDRSTKTISIYNPNNSGLTPELIGTISAPTMADKIFMGWSTNPNAIVNDDGTIDSPAFTEGNSYKLDATTDVATLYAVWANAVTMTIDATGYGDLYDFDVYYNGSPVVFTNEVAQISVPSGINVWGILGNILASDGTVAKATATVSTDSDVRSLELYGWQDVLKENITSSSTAVITEAFTVYPIWTGWKTSTLTIDLVQNWVALGGKDYVVVGSARVLESKVINGYTLTYSPAGGLALDSDDANDYGDVYDGGGTLTLEQSCMVVGNIPEYVMIEFAVEGSSESLVVTFESLGIQLYNMHNVDNAPMFGFDYSYQFLTTDISSWGSNDTPSEMAKKLTQYAGGYIGSGLTLYVFYDRQQ